MAAKESLETLAREAGGALNLLRRSTMGLHVFPGIPPEFTNWRDEVRSWKDSCALLEQSYHMSEVHLRGSAVIPFLKELSVNKLDPFPVLRGKQIVVASPDGYLVGDAIIFREAEDFFRIVGAPPCGNWVYFRSLNTSHDVKATRDESYSIKPGIVRDVFRFQIQGPNAADLMRDVANGTLPEVKFFHIGELEISGKRVRALRHGMVGKPGYEIYGAWQDQQPVREAFEKAGPKYGLRKVGGLAYSTTAQESGWLPTPLPAIYHGADMRPYREWLDAGFMETSGSLGGSYISNDISDYYVDPIEAGYESLIDFNRDFIGRDALRERAKNVRRKKVTLEWNDDDAADVMRSSLFPDEALPAKYMNLPVPMYVAFQYDEVLKNGRHIGVSNWPAYCANSHHFISLGLIELEHANIGDAVTLMWGEPESHRRSVERHEVREIRATVAQLPYFEKVIKGAKK